MESTGQQFKNALRDAYGPIMKPGEISQDFNKYTKEMKEDESLKGGEADNDTLLDIAMKHAFGDKVLTTGHKINSILGSLKSQLKKGIKVEMEHTNDVSRAKEIAMDHLKEDPNYYTKLKKIENKEQLIVRPVKKSVVDKFLGSGKKMHKPINKLFYMSKSEMGETEKKLKTTAKREFSQDLQNDKDFNEFKKNAKYNVRGRVDTYGVPNVSVEDPYIKKKTKYGRPGRGKEETTEATSSGSSGAFSGPIAFQDSEFLRKSFAETPGKLKEGLSSGAMGLDKVEAKEATSSGSVGGYETPAMWAKSTKKKDWGPSRKTQYKGGSFVQVKKKCTKFPYCNQGDITNLKLSKNESVKEAIKRVASKLNIDESAIVTILEREYQKKVKSGK